MRKPRKYRVRKKMAEFLVKEHIPPHLIREIIVKNPETHQRVAAMVGDSLPKCRITVDTKFEYYYRGYD